MNTCADVIVTELHAQNRKLEDDLDRAKGELHFMRIKLDSLGVCDGDCGNCGDEPCKGAI